MNYYKLLIDNEIFRKRRKRIHYEEINKLSVEDLRLFINLVTINCNPESGMQNQNFLDIIDNTGEQILNRKKLFLLPHSGYKLLDLYFNFNILIYIGDLYQKKAPPIPNVVDKSDLNVDPDVFLPTDFRSQTLDANNNAIQVNWGVNNRNNDFENIKANPAQAEISYEKYISALYAVYEILEINPIIEDVEILILDFLNYFAITLLIDDENDINETAIAQTGTAQTGTAQTGTAQTGTAQTGTQNESFTGKIVIESYREDKKLKEGFTSIPKNNISPILNVNKRNITQLISIDSRFRKNYYNTLSTAYSVDLLETQKNVSEMTIVAIEMPATFYSISERLGNNTMLVIGNSSHNSTNTLLTSLNYVDSNKNVIDFNPVKTAWRVKLQDGNYDTTSWLTDKLLAERSINEALTLATPGAIDNNGIFAEFKLINKSDMLNSNFDGTMDIRYNINSVNGKSVFSTPLPQNYNTNTITYSFNDKKIYKIRFNVDIHGSLDTNTNIQMRLGWAIGFRAAEYTVGSNEINNIPFSAISEGVGFISTLRYGYLSIEDYQNNSHPSLIALYNNYISDKKIMTRICLAPIRLKHDLSSRDTSFFSHRRTPRKYFNPVNISKLTINFFDEFGRIIHLNNMDWSITLQFTKA